MWRQLKTLQSCNPLVVVDAVGDAGLIGGKLQAIGRRSRWVGTNSGGSHYTWVTTLRQERLQADCEEDIVVRS